MKFFCYITEAGADSLESKLHALCKTYTHKLRIALAIRNDIVTNIPLSYLGIKQLEI